MSEKSKTFQSNPMKEIRVEKITLNIGCGTDQNKLDKALLLLKTITNAKPVKTFAKKRIPEFGLRPGLPIGAKVTLRKDKAEKLLVALLEAKDKILKSNSFDDNGNVSFGIEEYIDIHGVKYNPEIGIMGLEVCITLERRGFRIRKRKKMKRKISKSHKITKEEAIEFMKKKFSVKVEE